MRPLGLYLHVPFCSTRCGYCAFHTTARWQRDALDRITDAMLADLDALRGLATEATTVYVGGGTPTVLPPARLAELVRAARSDGSPLEVTVEANPESATADTLDALAEAGATRLSVGVQTLEPPAAAALGRRLTSPAELESIRRYWPGSLGADLIHGAPGSSTRGMLDAIDALVDLGFEHLSVYTLSVEKGTPLARSVARGAVRIPAADAAWSRILDAIERRGLRRYEVSNFALPGRECRHNEGYWRGADYLGIGPSAVSTLGEAAIDALIRGGQRPAVPPSGAPDRFARHAVRLTQPADHARFLTRRHPLDAEREELGPRELLVEYVMLGLRTAAGIEIEPLRAIAGDGPGARLADELARAEAGGLLVIDDERARPTGRGLDLLDRLLARLVPALLADLESAQY
ncbi:MAG: coproporphyrinogen-III oxidase family protein, partial [Spirochaetota bacterium]